MSVSKNGCHMKDFQAWDRVSKYLCTEIYSNATSKSAKKFLLKLVQECPFPIKSIQVDGGSEFRAEFEEACAELGIDLIVLPPRKPQYNGGVERSHRTFREEFYAKPTLADSIGAFRHELKLATHKYNSYRPHFSLQGLTPFQYINSILPEAA